MSSPGAVPPPDLSAYVDLRPYDIPDQDIIDTAIAALKLNLPGWIPREGNTEMVIIESVALEIAEAIVAVNRLPGAVVEAILLLAGVDRDYGAPPVATAEITFGDLLGHTVPGGTRVVLRMDDSTSVVFLVEPPGLTVNPGSDSGTVSLIGDVFTAVANGVPAGTRLDMADPLPFVESVELTAAIADGRDSETDDGWRDRGVQRLSRLSDAYVVPRHFQAAALERPEVEVALAIDLYDPTQAGVPGDHVGHITVAVLGENATALSIAAKDAIETDLEAGAVGMLDVHVMDATVVSVPVAATVVAADGADSAIVTANIQEAVANYLDPLAWSFGGTVYLNEMISLIDQVEGVSRVVAVTINAVAADYVLTGVAALPDAGTVTVTIQAGP